MNVWISLGLFIFSALFCADDLFAASDTPNNGSRYSYPLKQVPAKIRVEGSSTLGGWIITQNRIGGRASLSVSIETFRDQIADLLSGRMTSSEMRVAIDRLGSEVQVSVDANGFDCGNDRMKKDLMRSIKAKEFPSIEYSFTRLEELPTLLSDENGPYVKMKVRGELLFGGMRRSTVHTTEIRLDGSSIIEVKGQFDLEMTTFNIEPPSAIFGLIKASDDFLVGYHLKILTDDMISFKE